MGNLNTTPGGRPQIRKFKQKKKNVTGTLVIAIILSLLLLIVAVFAVLSIKGIFTMPDPDDEKNPPPSSSNGDVTTDVSDVTSDTPVSGDSTSSSADTTTPVTTDTPDTGDTVIGQVEYEYKEFSSTQIGVGDLVIINSSHLFQFTEGEKDIITVYGNKNNAYVLSSAAHRLHRNAVTAINKMAADFYAETELASLMLNGSYRTFEKQQENYTNAVTNKGQDYANRYVSVAGGSDYHSGLTFDLKVYTENGPVSLSSKAEYSWIKDNCHKYGIVNRYPSSKSAITGINFLPDTYRYVGVPHAQVMKEKGFCLEEYIDYVKDYKFSGAHLKVTADDGGKYEIFYVDAMSSGITMVPVPKDSSVKYTVSGDNAGGFIVTVTLR